MTTTIYVEIEGVEVEADVSYTIGSTGIGKYEFWGQQCNDQGQNVIEDITVLSVSVNVNGKIKEFPSTNRICEIVQEKIVKDPDYYFEHITDEWEE